MERLCKKNFAKFELLNPFFVKGGDGSTSYSTPSGKSGKDCYSDDDGDGKLSSGDAVLLDNGQWIIKP